MENMNMRSLYAGTHAEDDIMTISARLCDHGASITRCVTATRMQDSSSDASAKRSTGRRVADAGLRL